MSALRQYQQDAIAEFYSWIRENEGDPCLVLPTGAGKSWVIAEVCRDAIARWPDTRVLMLTHQKELIAQDYEKLLMVWPDAPAGIYSASLKRREMDSQVLFAGVQSVRNRAQEIGFRNLIIVDECHLISHKEAGVYRTLIDELRVINPRLRVLGLTATPWRLGHGSIADGDALFDGLSQRFPGHTRGVHAFRAVSLGNHQYMTVGQVAELANGAAHQLSQSTVCSAAIFGLLLF